MIVESTQMQKCGQGTPMFSRRGKSTSVQYMVFNENTSKSESSFSKMMKENESKDNANMEELDTIFEQLKNESLDEASSIMKEEVKKAKKSKEHKQMYIFRSVSRDQSPIYKIMKPTVAVSDGVYNVNYSVVEQKPYITDFKLKEPTQPKSQINQKPFCIQKGYDCSYWSRINFKRKTTQKVRLSALESNLIMHQQQQQQIHSQAPQLQQDMPAQLNSSFMQDEALRSNTQQNLLQEMSLKKQNSNKWMEQMKSKSFQTSQREFLTTKQITSHIKSPISFAKQTKRIPITSGVNASEDRFIHFNSMPSNISKYRKTVTPDFSKTSNKGTLDVFFGSSIKNQVNANNQIYNPKYDLVCKPLTQGIPNFKRFISREQKEFLENNYKLSVPDSYDHDKITTAYSLLSASKKPQQLVKFESIQGRDDNLMYQNMEKEEIFPENVSFKDYLPNHIRNSPLKKEFSHSHTTKKYRLKRIDPRWNQAKTMKELDNSEISRILYTRPALHAL